MKNILKVSHDGRLRWVVSIFSVLILSSAVMLLNQVIAVSNYVFIFKTSLTTLSEIYPNYYLEIFILTKLIILSPLVFIGLLILAAQNRNSQVVLRKYLKYDREDFRNEVIFLFGITTLSIAVYYFSKYWFTDYVAIQIFTARAYLYTLVIYYFSLLAFNHAQVIDFFRRFLFEDDSKWKLAVFRIVFFGYLIYVYRNYLYNNQEIGQLSKQGLPGITWLIEILPVNPSIYQSACIIGAICSFCIVIGFKTRFFLLVNALIIFYVIASPNFYGKIWHNQFIIWITWILSASPCHHAFSIDSKIKKNQQAEGWAYGFPIKIIWLHFGMIYFFAGFYKLWLCGFDWALGESMINQVRLEWFEHNWKVPEIRIDNYPIFLNLSGLIVVYFELLFVFLILNNSKRLFAVIGGLTMHSGIALIMYISFFQYLVVFYFFFLDKALFLRKSIRQVSFTISPNFRDYKILIPSILLIGNLLYGILNINSYPFSIYPVYAELIPSNVKYFHYQDNNEDEIEIRNRSKTKGSYFETYSRHEYHLIRQVEFGYDLTCERVFSIWDRWAILFPELNQFDTVNVFIAEQSLMPEDSNKLVSKKPLAQLILKNNHCSFEESIN